MHERAKRTRTTRGERGEGGEETILHHDLSTTFSLSLSAHRLISHIISHSWTHLLTHYIINLSTHSWIKKPKQTNKNAINRSINRSINQINQINYATAPSGERDFFFQNNLTPSMIRLATPRHTTLQPSVSGSVDPKEGRKAGRRQGCCFSRGSRPSARSLYLR